MYSFGCDYLEGCHEKILEALAKSNMVQEPGYGSDSFSESAREKIRQACQVPDAQIWFLNGGTQTNQVVIDSLLEKYEGVLAAETGHVSVHEAGAIEFSGHKVLTLPSHCGKVDAGDLEKWLRTYYADDNYEHMVFPGMLYISHPTEYGTLYTKAELEKLAKVCHAYDIPLFLDGARLGYGLMAYDTDVTLPLIARICDAFYIGGTKVGALSGEAVVFPKKNAPKHFLTRIKQHGALSAKGRLIGIQFDTLFTDDLYFQISRHAIDCAMQVKEILQEAGCTFYLESPTNQQFVIMRNEDLAKLSESIQYGFWEKQDETHTVVRFATSWATTQEGIEALRRAMRDLQNN